TTDEDVTEEETTDEKPSDEETTEEETVKEEPTEIVPEITSTITVTSTPTNVFRSSSYKAAMPNLLAGLVSFISVLLLV
ncbi:hypothetical protein BC833DRAFT_617077, partial [Globomyces pollinis-pini]